MYCRFEVLYVWLQFIERNLVYPLLVMSISTMFAMHNQHAWLVNYIVLIANNTHITVS